MIIRKFSALAAASLIVANCATTPGEEGFCQRNTAVCIIAGVAVVAGIVVAASGGGGGGGGIYSDLRLKQDVRPVGTLPNGLQLYAYRYRNDDRTFVSVVAQDLLEDPRFRHAVTQGENGYYMVNPGALGLEVAGSIGQFYEAGQSALRVAVPVSN